MQALAEIIVRDAAARQNGLAPLYADLEAALTRPGAELPQPVREAANLLMALRLDPGTGADLSASDIKSALAQAGLATGAATDTLVAGADLKTTLLTLQDALATWVDQAATAAPEANPGAAQLPAGPAQQAMHPAPLPPFRGAPTVPQAPVEASLPPDAQPLDVALHLLTATNAALARHTLLQIASLPDAPGGSPRGDQATRATFDIPLVAPQGTGVVQIRIEHDDERRSGPELRGPTWRARFSIEVEPIGKVQASIALIGDRANVTLHAERVGSADRLRGGLPLLQSGLREAALDPGDIQCRTGSPAAAAAAAPGLFVDHAS